MHIPQGTTDTIQLELFSPALEAALRPSADYDNLYYAGLSRAIGDWILGMNATRLYTKRYAQNRNVLSIGLPTT